MSNDRYVSYEEYPRDEERFPGNTEEVYPDYIIGWFLVVNPGTSKRIVEASKVDSYTCENTILTCNLEPWLHTCGGCVGDRDTKGEVEHQPDRCQVDERLHQPEGPADDQDSAEQEHVCEGLHHCHAYREEYHNIQGNNSAQ